MLNLEERTGILIGLAFMAYLGFYVYGLVLGIFSPVTMIGFTVLAIAFAILVGLRMRIVRRNLRSDDAPAHVRMVEVQRADRERRGF